MPIIEVTRTYSNRELLCYKNFAEMIAEESEAIKKMILRLLWKVSHNLASLEDLATQLADLERKS